MDKQKERELKARERDLEAKKAQERFEKKNSTEKIIGRHEWPYRGALEEMVRIMEGEKAPKEDLKFDHEKPMPHLVFDSMNLALMEVVKVATFGARKYEPESWKLVENGSTRYKSALYRHLLDPQELDEESELDHLAHVAWNALALLQLKMEQEK